MKDKTRLWLMKLFGATLIAGIIVFIIYVFITESNQTGFNPFLLIILIPAAVIILILVANVKRLSAGVSSGLPIDDELSQRLKERSGYLTFMITIYFLLGLMFYHGLLVEDYGFPGLLVRHAIIVLLFFMLIIYGMTYFVLRRRGIK